MSLRWRPNTFENWEHGTKIVKHGSFMICSKSSNLQSITGHYHFLPWMSFIYCHIEHKHISNSTDKGKPFSGSVCETNWTNIDLNIIGSNQSFLTTDPADVSIPTLIRCWKKIKTSKKWKKTAWAIVATELILKPHPVWLLPAQISSYIFVLSLRWTGL